MQKVTCNALFVAMLLILALPLSAARPLPKAGETPRPVSFTTVKHTTKDKSVRIAPQKHTTLPGTFRIGKSGDIAWPNSLHSLSRINLNAAGVITLPYTNTFDGEGSLSGYQIIDGNGDGKSWYSDGDVVRASYNSYQDLDEWLITPAIELEAGKTYPVSIDAAALWEGWIERIEIKAGAANTAEAMTIQVLPPTDVELEDFMTFEGTLVVPADGTYHIGVHAISDADMYGITIDNLVISSPVTGSGPSIVTDATAVADTNGDNKVTISFTAPSTNLSGESMTEPMSITISRNGADFKTLEDIQPGQKCTVADDDAPHGSVIYSLTATNANGTSTPVEVSTYVGFNIPGNISVVNAVQTEKVGEVKLSWTPVTTDSDGRALPDGSVTYKICTVSASGMLTDVAEGITGTEYTYSPAITSSQEFFQWIVYPVNSTGSGFGHLSDMIAVGTPYQLPFNESFTDAYIYYNWATVPGVGTTMQFGLADDKTFSDVESQDQDNGFFFYMGEYLDDNGVLESGLISIPQGKQTHLRFYQYLMGDDDENILTVSVLADGKQTPLNTFVGGSKGWTLRTIDLTDYAGQNIQLCFYVKVVSYVYAALDNIQIGAPVLNDLALTKLTAPKSTAPGKTAIATATVANYGINSAANYSVTLYADGEPVSTVSGPELKAGEKAEVELSMDVTPLHGDEVELHAMIEYAPDENSANNISQSLLLTVPKNSYTVPEGLTATETAEGIMLNWADVAIEAARPETVTESFEDAVSFNKEVDGWTFVDVDDSPVYGFFDIEIPGIVMGETKASFFVFDDSASEDYEDVFKAKTGNKFIAALCRYDEQMSDDWAISPSLSGEAQQIEFYAMSFYDFAPDRIDIYYSMTNSVSPSDFIKLESFETVHEVPAEWTLYTAQLPEGAKRFAIRSHSTEGFMLMIDDITYTSGGTSLNLLGYNIYRDCQKMNTEPVAKNSWLDENPGEHSHTYNVTAVYDLGESSASNSVSLGMSGLTAPTLKAASVTANGRQIVITGAEGETVSIHTPDGLTVATLASSPAVARVNVVAGIYIVRVGSETFKIAVR
ncbi:MAG: choice-of-anchor J domain-containing protein [Bacteroides sp.]|nr:choice-of-anchor J domain-containing protein [Bacteroides sp.]